VAFFLTRMPPYQRTDRANIERIADDFEGDAVVSQWLESNGVEVIRQHAVMGRWLGNLVSQGIVGRYSRSGRKGGNIYWVIAPPESFVASTSSAGLPSTSYAGTVSGVAGASAGGAPAVLRPNVGSFLAGSPSVHSAGGGLAAATSAPSPLPRSHVGDVSSLCDMPAHSDHRAMRSQSTRVEQSPSVALHTVAGPPSLSLSHRSATAPADPTRRIAQGSLPLHFGAASPLHCTGALISGTPSTKLMRGGARRGSEASPDSDSSTSVTPIRTTRASAGAAHDSIAHTSSSDSAPDAVHLAQFCTEHAAQLASNRHCNANGEVRTTGSFASFL
jgi:hypothetical protein